MENDDWGTDPSVRTMRRVFATIEAEQRTFLERLGIGHLDGRLRKWRKMALRLFEQAWSAAVGHGMVLEEKNAAALYLHCLAKALTSTGVAVPKGLLPEGPVERLLKTER